jgi:hypothetical protein
VRVGGIERVPNRKAQVIYDCGVRYLPATPGYYKVMVWGRQVDTALTPGRAKRRLRQAVTQELRRENHAR